MKSKSFTTKKLVAIIILPLLLVLGIHLTVTLGLLDQKWKDAKAHGSIDGWIWYLLDNESQYDLQAKGLANLRALLKENRSLILNFMQSFPEVTVDMETPVTILFALSRLSKATILIDLKGNALGAQYEIPYSVYAYSGAQIEVNLRATESKNGEIIFSKKWTLTKNPPTSILVKHTKIDKNSYIDSSQLKPSGAPFQEIINDELIFELSKFLAERVDLRVFLPVLNERAYLNGSSFFRDAVVKGIARSNNPERIRMFVDAISDKQLRRIAVQGLCEAKVPEAITPLTRFLLDRDGYLSAARTEAVTPLDRLLLEQDIINDFKDIVRTIQKIGDSKCIPALIEFLPQAVSINIQEEVVSALKSISGLDLGTEASNWERWWKESNLSQR